MKKNLFYFIMAALLFSFNACQKDDPAPVDTGKPGEVTITYTIDKNVVSYHAEATNAVSYVWDLGNGETPTGQDVTGTYTFPGDYSVSCTAKGREDDTKATVTVAVAEGDPEVFSDVNIALSGYNSSTGESDAVWVWENELGHSNAVGPFPYTAGTDTAFFAPIDDSWWGNDPGTVDEGSLDDKYMFKLNSSMEYINDFGATFMVNWAWMAGNYGITVPVWSDTPYDGYEAPEASWSVKHIDNINDTLTFVTKINGVDSPGAYVLELTNGADLGMEVGVSYYQILSIDDQYLWVRTNSAPPANLYDIYGNPDDLESHGINAAQQEWRYLRFIRESK